MARVRTPRAHISDHATFSASYTEARDKFLGAARAAGARVAHTLHEGAKGPQGEALYLDVAVLGRPDAPNVMVVGCGTHGIEGFSGSAAQTAWMVEGGAARIGPDVAMVFVHAHNPWGFAHHQRVTEENVDLNRNFVDHARPYPANPGYAALHSGVSPARWDDASVDGVFAALAEFRANHGEQAFPTPTTAASMSTLTACSSAGIACNGATGPFATPYEPTSDTRSALP